MPSRKKSQRVTSWQTVLVVIFCLGVFGAILDLGTLPDGSEFVGKNPSSTALINSRALERTPPLKTELRWRALSQISPSLQKAVIISEDMNFYSHAGFDWAEVQSALSQALRHLSFPRGASTITQQLVKNLYLSESKNPWRKVREAVITSQMESHLSKSRILELYLNVIEWGDGIYGAEAAAQHYFSSSARSLSNEQAAFLAAIIPNPRSTFNPKLHPTRVEKRTQFILKRMQRRK